MEITEIIISAGRTFNHPYESYSNLRPNVTLKATLINNEDPDKAVKELQAKAEKLVEDHKQLLLKQLEEIYEMQRLDQEYSDLESRLRQAQERMDFVRKRREQFKKEFNQKALPFANESA